MFWVILVFESSIFGWLYYWLRSLSERNEVLIRFVFWEEAVLGGRIRGRVLCSFF